MIVTTPVTLCIINHNGAEHLKAAFQAVRCQAFQFAEVLLIDNASDDSSLLVARELCPEVKPIRLEQNLGPGAARNAGFQLAANELILFQDNDIQLGRDSARLLLRQLEGNTEALLVAPRVLYAHDPSTVQYDGADCHFLGLMATRNTDRRIEHLDSDPVETTSMVSACFMIHRGRWRGKELFDETFEFNLEDHDFGVRACLSGHSIRVEPQACVTHGSGTPGLSYRDGQMPGKNRLYYLTLNRWVVISKCYARKTIILLLPALLLYEAMLFSWLASHGHFRVWTRAIGTYWKTRYRTRAQRRQVQSERRVPDRMLLREYPLPLTRAIRGGSVARIFTGTADALLRQYWRLVRRWI